MRDTEGIQVAIKQVQTVGLKEGMTIHSRQAESIIITS